MTGGIRFVATQSGPMRFSVDRVVDGEFVLRMYHVHRTGRGALLCSVRIHPCFLETRASSRPVSADDEGSHTVLVRIDDIDVVSSAEGIPVAEFTSEMGPEELN